MMIDAQMMKNDHPKSMFHRVQLLQLILVMSVVVGVVVPSSAVDSFPLALVMHYSVAVHSILLRH